MTVDVSGVRMTGPSLTAPREIENIKALRFSQSVEQLAQDPVGMVSLGILGYGYRSTEELPRDMKMLMNAQACATVARSVLVLAAKQLLPGAKIWSTYNWGEVMSILDQSDSTAAVEVYFYADTFLGDFYRGVWCWERSEAFFPGHAFTIVKFAEQSPGEPCFRIFQSYVERYSLGDYVTEHQGEYLTREELQSKIVEPLLQFTFHRGPWTAVQCDAFHKVAGVEVTALLGKTPRVKGCLTRTFSVVRGRRLIPGRGTRAPF